MSVKTCNTFFFTLLGLVFLFAAIVGCVPCIAAPKKAARHGIVLECRIDRSDRRRDVCTVSTPKGDVDYHYWRCQ
jgi:hypothetical protein